MVTIGNVTFDQLLLPFMLHLYNIAMKSLMCSIYCPPYSVENANSTRVRQWGYSLDELLSDKAGRNVFEEFCEKQCCAENIRFWVACDNLHSTSLSQVPLEVHHIYRLVTH